MTGPGAASGAFFNACGSRLRRVLGPGLLNKIGLVLQVDPTPAPPVPEALGDTS